MAFLEYFKDQRINCLKCGALITYIESGQVHNEDEHDIYSDLCSKCGDLKLDMEGLLYED